MTTLFPLAGGSTALRDVLNAVTEQVPNASVLRQQAQVMLSMQQQARELQASLITARGRLDEIWRGEAKSSAAFDLDTEIKKLGLLVEAISEYEAVHALDSVATFIPHVQQALSQLLIEADWWDRYVWSYVHGDTSDAFLQKATPWLQELDARHVEAERAVDGVNYALSRFRTGN